MSTRYEEYYSVEDIKCRLITEEKCSNTVITFLKNTWNEGTYNKYLTDFKSNKNVHRIIKVENEIEEVLLERNKGD